MAGIVYKLILLLAVIIITASTIMKKYPSFKILDKNIFINKENVHDDTKKQTPDSSVITTSQLFDKTVADHMTDEYDKTETTSSFPKNTKEISVYRLGKIINNEHNTNSKSASINENKESSTTTNSVNYEQTLNCPKSKSQIQSPIANTKFDYFEEEDDKTNSALKNLTTTTIEIVIETIESLLLSNTSKSINKSTKALNYKNLLKSFTALPTEKSTSNQQSIEKTPGSKSGDSNHLLCEADVANLNGQTLTWDQALVGSLHKPNEFCLQSNYKPITRKCIKIGDVAEWTSIEGVCSEDIELSKLTETLEDMMETEFSPDELTKELQNLTTVALKLKTIRPIDVDIMSEVLQSTAMSCPHLGFLYSVNNIMKYNKTLLQQSQEELNTTDKVLCALDHFLISNDDCNFKDSHLIIQKILVENNTIGLMLLKNTSSNFTDFRGYYITFLHKFYYLEQMLKKNFELAIVIPEGIFLNTTDKSVKLSIFFDDSLFNTNTKFNVSSWIINILISHVNKLNEPIKVFHKLYKNKTINNCVHWNFGYYNNDDINIKGNWSINNKSINFGNNFQICEYYHLTHFALLITDGLDLSDYNTVVLEVLSTAGLLFSMCGLLVIFFIAITFKQFRCTANNQIGISISLSLFAQIILVFISNFINEGIFCIAAGVLLHYSILTGYFWMFIISYSSYRRLVVVFYKHIKNMIVKYSIFAWGVPVIPIICILAISPEAYMKGYSGICYPEGIYLYLGIILPIALILSINLVIFFMIIYNLTSKRRKLYSGDSSLKTFSIIKSTIILFFLMGLNWIFGVFVAFNFNIIFVYLFTITATLQGFVIFVYFIFCFKTNREMWMLTLNRKLSRFKNKSSKSSFYKTDQVSQTSQ